MRSRRALVACAALVPLLAPGAAMADVQAVGSAWSANHAAAISKAKAKALAKAGVLTAKDMKGYEAEPATADPDDAKEDKAVYKCLGAKAPTYLARNLGFGYTRGELSIDSSADVASSVSAAKADLKAIKSAKGPACYKKSLTAYLKRSGFTITSLSVKAVSATVKGADAVSAMQIKLVASINGQEVRLSGYDLSILVGQTEITVSPGRFDGKNPSLSQSTTLGAIVAKRVRAV